MNERINGSLGEWFKPAVLKTADPKGSVSSNLTASAIHMKVLCVTTLEHRKLAKVDQSMNRPGRDRVTVDSSANRGLPYECEYGEIGIHKGLKIPRLTA